MARITVEDCLKEVGNRFELVIVAAKRARQLERDGSDVKVAWENDKPTVVALREIAEGKISNGLLEEYDSAADVDHSETQGRRASGDDSE